MKLGEEDDDSSSAGSGCKRSGSDDAAMDGASIKHQALRLAEDLSLPSVQVVVMSANMGCSHCRQRVTKVVSKMNGLLDYMVDFGKKEVTVRGTVLHNKKKKKKRTSWKHCKNGVVKIPSSSTTSPGQGGASRPLSWFLRCYGS